MKKLLLVSILGFVMLLSACETSTQTITCGEGTIAQGNTCVIDDSEEPETCEEGFVKIDEECEAVATCSDDQTLNAATNECEDNVVDTCATTEWENPTSGECEVVPTCETTETYNAATNECETTVPTCGAGQHLENNVCVDDTVDTGSIQLVVGADTSFNIGDTLPDFTTYFTSEGVTIDPSMIQHNLLLDANNIMTTSGVYSVTITIGNESKTITIVVTDSSVNYDDIITEGVAGIYVDTSQQTVFDIGDYMPNFMEYFIAYDGANYVSITPDLVLHNLLLSADNRMIQAGTYQVFMDLVINGTTFSQSIDITVSTIGGATAETIGSTGWEVQDSEFLNANLFDSWFVPNGDVVIDHDATAGEVDVHVNTVGMNFWDVLFAQPGKTFERGYTYEVTYRMKTGLEAGRDVVVFAEPFSGGAKLLEEQVSLTTAFQDFTFTFQSTTDTVTGMVGVFIGANLPGAHPGSIIFDSITITRTGEPAVDVHFQDMPNQEFTDSDISEWGTEGNITLAHDATGYLVVSVNGLTGNFWDDNIQLPGFKVTAGKTYTVAYTLKTSYVEGRDVTFFVEDTDAGYAKYFEETATLTDAFQTFTYNFTPTADNVDTKIGIFLGAMDNALIGDVIIDSIVVTESN